MRKSLRLQVNSSRKEAGEKDEFDVKVVSDNNDSESEDDDTPKSYMMDGVEYSTYQDMVNAKRRRNEKFLENSGLLKAAESIKNQPSRRGIMVNKKRKVISSQAPRRQSRRLAGVTAEDIYVERESLSRFTIGSTDGSKDPAKIILDSVHDCTPRFYRDRINDGSDLTLTEVIENSESKYQTSATDAVEFFRQPWKTASKADENIPESVASIANLKKQVGENSPQFVASMANLNKQVEQLSVDDENCVAKVVPGRIYSIAAHPSEDDLVVAAGDKTGHVGLWHVNSEKDDGAAAVYLFRYHTSVVACLEWNQTKHQLVSTSYDGTVRLLDVASESVSQIFSTYDDSSEYKKYLGYGLDTGHRFWTQYSCLDHRYPNCLFLSTSQGTAMHLDLRTKGQITFHEQLSEKKINTLSLHPNGHSLISSGLDNMVQLWDVRKFGNRKSSSATKSSLAAYHGGRSINSAFFSPSGNHVVCTTMNNKLDIIHDLHLQPGTQNEKKTNYLKPSKSIAHNNQTGRWLSTLMAQFHPSMDIFCVGSMKQPREMEIFSAEDSALIAAISGASLSAVASRCCFHPSTNKLALIGGNSSGRVTVAR